MLRFILQESAEGRRKSKDVDKRAALIEAEKKETESVKWSIYLDYFKAAGVGMSISTFFLYLIFQGTTLELFQMFKTFPISITLTVLYFCVLLSLRSVFGRLKSVVICVVQ